MQRSWNASSPTGRPNLTAFGTRFWGFASLRCSLEPGTTLSDARQHKCVKLEPTFDGRRALVLPRDEIRLHLHFNPFDSTVDRVLHIRRPAQTVPLACVLNVARRDALVPKRGI